jgi:hypothetical protein
LGIKRIQEDGKKEGCMTTAEQKHTQVRRDAARIIKEVRRAKEPVTPERVKKMCGMSGLDWFSTRWRDALALAKEKGLVGTGRGRNRTYTVKKGRKP